ncbi:MAG: hypothetical protein K2X47_18800 [Bdellovibrionales bacterium]|nr:hypothetical protein [Bdellovibrionales bacterium]
MKKLVAVLVSCLLISPLVASAKSTKKDAPKGAHTTHTQHEHKHDASCGHEARVHGDHTDYMHDGHAHFMHAGAGKAGEHYDECHP